ncbi:endonuclease domain-containing protein [Sphingobacterium spiritivorum]|uniref:endonuclease domain-containing protein n=1 Tax=Sphingobacterium spiritivorum TaxID=258 RepID=UPI00191B01F6|nr:endonuclease domain-containing protein [Sphingobacterium spiritivorum]QQT24917.1 endonuclease domain-containing protein [Sphingobacterium spiritivorum]
MDSKSFRRQLRRNQTPAEATFWNLVRSHRLNGLRFRRQHTIDNYIVDFYCPELKLVIELDGSIHDNLGQSNYDYERDTKLRSMGYKVIRIENEAVLKNPEVVLLYLLDHIKQS